MSTTPDRVRLRHKDTSAEHDFHPRTVERWKAAGWEPIAEDEQPTDGVDQPLALPAPVDEPAPVDGPESASRSRAKSSATSSSTRA